MLPVSARLLFPGIPLVSLSSHARTGLLGITLITVLMVGGCGGGDDGPKPPTLQTTAFQVQEDQSLSASLGAQDPAGTTLTITVDTGPTHGALTGPDATGAFTYQPNQYFSGADSFHVTVTDVKGARTSASVAITVQHVPAPPVTAADSARTAPAVAVTINVLANDTDPRGHPLTPKITTQSPGGTAVVNSDGTVTFTPAAGFAGTATVVYQDVNTENDTSAATNIQILVRPLQKSVYLTSTPQILVDDTNTVTSVTNPAGAGSPIGISLSANGRTLLYDTYLSGPVVWYAADLRGSLTGQYVADTGVSYGTGPIVLSNDGTMALYPVDGIAGFFNSTEVFLEPLFGGSGPTGKVNPGTFSSEEVNDYYFAGQDQGIYYISHSPTNWQSQSAIFGTTVSGIGTAVQLSPTTPDGDTVLAPLRTTSSGSQIVYMAVRNNTLGVYEVNTSTPGTEVALGPTSSYVGASLIVTSFNIASQGHYGAYVMQWNLSGVAGPAYAYLVNLDQPGTYAAIGGGFQNGTNLSAPLFSPDGQSILFAITGSAGIALWETSVAQPASFVQMSPMYPVGSLITNFQYTPDGLNIVYTEGQQSTNVFDLFTVQRAHPGTATQLNQALGTTVFQSFISISADSTTIAYAQAKTTGGPLSLFMVDRTTPGLPFEVAQNIKAVGIGVSQPFYLLPAN